MFRQTDAKQRGKRLRVGNFRGGWCWGRRGWLDSGDDGLEWEYLGARLSATVGTGRLREVGPVIMDIQKFPSAGETDLGLEHS